MVDEPEVEADASVCCVSPWPSSSTLFCSSSFRISIFGKLFNEVSIVDGGAGFGRK